MSQFFPPWNIYTGDTGCHGLPFPPPYPPNWPPYYPTDPPQGADLPLPPTGDPGQPGSVPAAPQEPQAPGVDAVLPPGPLGLNANPSWRYRTAQDEGYPWTEPTLHVRNYPMPGAFYDASNPGGYRFTHPLQYQRALLGSALVMAGMDTSLATSSAGAALRKQLADLQAAGKFNDTLYGTSAVGLAGGRFGVGPHDRGINWEARHAPVRELLTTRTAPHRTTGIDGQRLEAYVEANRRPLVWNPAVNLDILRNERRVAVDDMVWEDGSSMIDPPPCVMVLGIEPSGVRFSGGAGFWPMVDRPLTARDWWRGAR